MTESGYRNSFASRQLSLLCHNDSPSDGANTSRHAYDERPDKNFVFISRSRYLSSRSGMLVVLRLLGILGLLGILLLSILWLSLNVVHFC
jgi:hypothetical protein